MSTYREIIKEFITSSRSIQREIEMFLQNDKKKDIIIDFQELQNFDTDIADILISTPDDILQDFTDILLTMVSKKSREPIIKNLHVRFKNLPKTLAIRDLASEHIHKFIQVSGIVTSKTEIKPYVKKAVYVCPDCGANIPILQRPYDRLVKPAKCPECGSKNIKLDIDKSTFIDAQYFKLQDLPESTHADVRVVEAVVLDDLCDTFNPGDRLVVTGIMRIVRDNREKVPTFKKVLEINHIEIITQDVEQIDITPEEEREIKELAKRDDIIDLITNSIAPSIANLRDEKFGIALSLFSGGTIKSVDGSEMRGESHVLLVGDPGVAKSTIVRFLKYIIPKGVVTTAKTSTSAGLTAVAVRDELTGSWVIEAGAIPKSNGGVCIIDEFDKMSERDRTSIHEALEQGTISVSKAGLNVTLPARATVIAVANPKMGRFDLSKPIYDQINLSPALLSRFDLIFAIIDTPDEEHDKNVAKHILDYRTGRKQLDKETIEPTLLRKYIAYARQNIHPVLSEDARNYLMDFYVNLRKKSKVIDGISKIPITPRQLESLVRLSMAYARMKLKNTIELEDVKIITEFWRRVMSRLFSDDSDIDMNIIELGVKTSKMQKIELIYTLIQQLEADHPDGVPYVKLLAVAKEKGFKEKELDEIIDILHRQSRIISPKLGLYKTV